MRKLDHNEIDNISAGKNEKIKVEIEQNNDNGKYELFTTRVLGKFNSEEEAQAAINKCAANGIDSVKWKE